MKPWGLAGLLALDKSCPIQREFQLFPLGFRRLGYQTWPHYHVTSTLVLRTSTPHYAVINGSSGQQQPFTLTSASRGEPVTKTSLSVAGAGGGGGARNSDRGGRRGQCVSVFVRPPACSRAALTVRPHALISEPRPGPPTLSGIR